MKIFAILLAVCLAVGGCPKLEVSARDTAATAQGFIVQAQIVHGTECKTNPGLQTCLIINQAVGAQNTLIDAIETYCGWPARPTAEQLKNASTLPCTRVASSQAALQAAVSNLNAILGDLKTAANK